jgi:hypothetical protein
MRCEWKRRVKLYLKTLAPSKTNAQATPPTSCRLHGEPSSTILIARNLNCQMHSTLRALPRLALSRQALYQTNTTSISILPRIYSSKMSTETDGPLANRIREQVSTDSLSPDSAITHLRAHMHANRPVALQFTP